MLLSGIGTVGRENIKCTTISTVMVLVVIITGDGDVDGVGGSDEHYENNNRWRLQ